jgi:hypothetical protein
MPMDSTRLGGEARANDVRDVPEHLSDDVEGLQGDAMAPDSDRIGGHRISGQVEQTPCVFEFLAEPDAKHVVGHGRRLHGLVEVAVSAEWLAHLGCIGLLEAPDLTYAVALDKRIALRERLFLAERSHCPNHLPGNVFRSSRYFIRSGAIARRLLP